MEYTTEKDTIVAVAYGQLNEVGTVGTILGIGGTVQVAGASAGTVVEINTGTIGTILGIGGTVQVAGASAGTTVTVDHGTISTLGIRHPDAFATVITTGTSLLGTIKPAVSGSAIYITDIIIRNMAPTNVQIASGGTSTGILGTFWLAGSQGYNQSFLTPISTAIGSALVYKQSANTGLSIAVQGYVD